jgi:hypothetical protein
VGLIAWFIARIGKISLIPLIKLYRNYDSEENLIEWISIAMFYFAVIMISHVLIYFGRGNIIIFLVSISGTVCLSFATNYLIRLTDKLLYSNPGNRIDNAHKAIWTYGLKRTEGKATKREVYEHYHGSFTWNKRFSGLLTFLRCLSIVFSTAVPALLLSSINLVAIIVSSITSLVIIFYKS